MKRYLLFFNLVLVSAIAWMNYCANQNFWYWKIWWFDLVMHFMGGLWIGLMSLWLFYFSGFFVYRKFDWNIAMIISLVSVFTVGVGWEVFEFLIEVDFSNNYISDTTGDLIMDVIGSLVAVQILLGNNKKQNEQQS